MKIDGLRILTYEKIENIHSTALKILGEIGIKVKLPEATELFKKPLMMRKGA